MGPDERDEPEIDERRGDGRAPITLRVDYKRLNTFFADYAKNISKGGTFIRTSRPLAVGTRFVFVLSAPRPNDEPTEEGAAPFELELTGEVRWVVPEAQGTDENPAGMGIKFVFASDAEREKGEASVLSLMSDALGPKLASRLLAR